MNTGYLGHYSNIPHRQYQVDNHYMASRPMVHQNYMNNGLKLEDLQLENLRIYMNHNYNMGPKPVLMNLEDVDFQNLVLVNGPNDVMVFGSNGIT